MFLVGMPILGLAGLLTGISDVSQGRGLDFRPYGLATMAPGSWNAPLDAFLAGAAAEARAAFDGPVTYSAGTWEVVDWGPFDAVGANLYRDAGNAATHADDLRRLFDHDLPVLVTEFGCSAYQGAEAKGANGDDVVDWTSGTPRLVGPPVRDEQVQADHIDELLDLFEAEGVAGAYVFQFIEPAAPYSDDPAHDLDMAGLSLVRVDGPDSPDAYEQTGRWHPKAAFDVLARR